ncbi:MAG: hypothetical protein K0R34_842 [Herbinix sp.]|jgi:hypothetical protein|nr:hypothetical protein [Herbinix sp.]
MTFGKELNQALKILLVFAVITSFFRLLQKLSPVIFVGINSDGIENFIEVYRLWFVAMLFIIVGLCMYIRKTDGKFNLAFIHNKVIRLTSGLLIMFEGIFSLSISIPVAFSNIITFHQFTTEFENTFGTSRGNLLTSNVIPSLINLLQVLLGLYLVLHKKRNKETNHKPN